MKILVACEESQRVCIAFREAGHEAYSCDIQDESGGYPQWHIKGDALKEAYSGKYDMMIAFPPCCHLAVSGAAHFAQKRKDGRQQKGIDFFLKIANAPIKHIAIENPIGIMSSLYRKPDQIIQPYQFGHEAQKSTCLWLKRLPLLKPTNIVGKGEFYVDISGRKRAVWIDFPSKGSGEPRKKHRSKTFEGIAKAMADQWSEPKYVEQLSLFGLME